jgi:hypothetical protein
MSSCTFVGRLLAALPVALLLVACPAADRAKRQEAPAAPVLTIERPRLPAEAVRARDEGAWPEPSAEELAELTREVMFAEPAGVADEAEPAPLPDEPLLAALARETLIFAQPSYQARRIGYLRAGAVVTRRATPAGHAGCAGGWYAIAPEGYVCAGRAATLDVGQSLVRAARRRPDRLAGLPYSYGRSRQPTPHFYTRLPARAEWLAVESDGSPHERRAKALGWSAAWETAPFEATPDFLSDGSPAPLPWGAPRTTALETGRALAGSGFAFIAFYERDGRRFGMTTDFSLVALDRVVPVESSSFHGLALSDGVTLPVAFVMSRSAHVYRADAAGRGLALVRPLAYREAVALSGQSKSFGGAKFVETRDGHYLHDARLLKVMPLANLPSFVKPEQTWVDVSVQQQVLVAYRGAEPVYVTLVSTGVDGLGDPEATHSTVRGTFAVQSKHVTATMDSDEEGDEYDLRDVPYVQYFERGYALHAAYWHDGFGAPRSHGCINLSPPDARWLFQFTDPPVPEKWHGALAVRGATLVHVRP